MEIENIREALKHSPDNLPLQIYLADLLFKNYNYEEAELEYKNALNLDSNSIKAKIGLANSYHKQNKLSVAIVIAEELQNTSSELSIKELYINLLIEDNNISLAIENYKLLLDIYPEYSNEEFDSKLRVGGNSDIADLLDDNAIAGMEKPSINFTNVGGLENVKKEIDLKIIQPLKNPKIYEAYGKKIGGGILLYGPPGCGKTYLAKATAGQINAKFYNIGINDILDMWIGNSEKNLHSIFETARKNKPCVLFFDEVDALGANRSDMKQSTGRQLINQFLAEMDGIDNDNDGILIIGATNAPWHLDPAFKRPGRFDRIIFVPPPDNTGREEILKLNLKEKPLSNIDYSSLAKKTENYSGADLEAIIDIAIESKLEKSISTGIPEPIDTKSLKNAISKHKATTKDWLNSAKNYAIYSNESGLYDDILSYLNIKK